MRSPSACGHMGPHSVVQQEIACVCGIHKAERKSSSVGPQRSSVNCCRLRGSGRESMNYHGSSGWDLVSPGNLLRTMSPVLPRQHSRTSPSLCEQRQPPRRREGLIAGHRYGVLMNSSSPGSAALVSWLHVSKLGVDGVEATLAPPSRAQLALSSMLLQGQLLSWEGTESVDMPSQVDAHSEPGRNNRSIVLVHQCATYHRFKAS